MAPRHYTLDQLVVAKQLRLVYERLPVSVLLTVVVSLAFSGLMLRFFDNRTLIEWLLLVQVVSGARYVLWRNYARAQPTPAQSGSWSVLFTIGTVAAGGSWAFGPLTMMPAAGRVETALLVVTLLSVSSVAVATLGAHFKAMLGFIATALPLTIFAVVRTGGSVEIVLAAALGAAFIALVAVGYQSSAATTQLLKAELELSEAVAETAAARLAAEASSRAKSQFLANMSHEVRTPLNGVLGMSEVLSASELDARQRRQVEMLRESASHLLHIVDDILDLSKIEAGRVELAKEEFDLAALVREAAALMEPRATQAGLQFSVELSPELPRQVIGDGVRLRQVLLNLLSNAIKFTPRGFVVLRARCDLAVDPDGPVTLNFEVADTGIGVSSADAERIFEAFTQADESTTRRFGGTGLGLAVCRQLTELMGGGITVESQPGAGSTFRFSIRVHTSRRAPQAIERPRASAALSR